MKFWLSRNSEISLREQLARQIVLAIVSDDLRAGDKLPSVREMALRYNVHANTVSQSYVWLEANGWVESKQGSGVFVRKKSAGEIQKAVFDSNTELDNLIEQFFIAAKTRGFYQSQIAERLRTRFEREPIEQIILVESNGELRKILKIEIGAATDLPIIESDSNGFICESNQAVAALEETSKMLLHNNRKIVLRINSVQNELRGKERPAKSELIGVASGWETFLKWSKMMLVAAGINHEQLILRDARGKDWQRGLASCAFVIADSATAQLLPENIRARVFRLIAQQTIDELRGLSD